LTLTGTVPAIRPRTRVTRDLPGKGGLLHGGEPFRAGPTPTRPRTIHEVQVYISLFKIAVLGLVAASCNFALADPPAFDPGLIGGGYAPPGLDCTHWLSRLKPDIDPPSRNAPLPSWTSYDEAAVSLALAAATQPPAAPFDCRVQIYLWLDSMTSKDPQWATNANPYPTHAFQTLLGQSTQQEILAFERRTERLPAGVPWGVLHQRSNTPLPAGACSGSISPSPSVDDLLNLSACLGRMKSTSNAFEAGKISAELRDSIAGLSLGNATARVAAGKYEALLSQGTLARIERAGGIDDPESDPLLKGLCLQANEFAPTSARKIDFDRPAEIAFWNEFHPWILQQFPKAGTPETMSREERRSYEKFIQSCPKYRGLISEAILAAHLSARERQQKLGRCSRFCGFTRQWRSWSGATWPTAGVAYQDALAALRGTFAIHAETQCPGAGIPSHIPLPSEFCTTLEVRVASAAESFLESKDSARILELAAASEDEEATRTLLQQQGDDPHATVAVESVYSKPYLLQLFRQLEAASKRSSGAEGQAEQFQAAADHLTLQITDDLDHHGTFQGLPGGSSLMNLFALSTNASLVSQDPEVIARNPAWLRCMREVAGHGNRAIGLPYNLPQMGQCDPATNQSMSSDENASFVRAVPFYQTLYHAARAEGKHEELSRSKKRLINALEKYQGRLFDLVAHINEAGQDGSAHSPYDTLASYYFYPALPTVVQSIQELEESGQLTERERERLEELKKDITTTLMGLLDEQKGFPPGGWAPEYTRPFDNLFAGIALSGLLDCGPLNH
jgi:hypothetical protein